MNTCIMNSLENIRTALGDVESLSSARINEMIGELEMIKMEIEQHIGNMPHTQAYRSSRDSGEGAVRNLAKILDLFEEIEDFDDIASCEKSEVEEIVFEIVELLEEINY